MTLICVQANPTCYEDWGIGELIKVLCGPKDMKLYFYNIYFYKVPLTLNNYKNGLQDQYVYTKYENLYNILNST